jgi:hypothetical protein
MSESELRPRVFITSLIRPGDVVLTTTPEPMSQTIQKVTGADCSGLLSPDNNLGENTRHKEVSDEQATSYVFP